MSEENIIQVQKVSKTYPGVKALNDMMLTVKKGEVHALVGENGAGKSTLIKVLAGVINPDEGAQIRIAGETVKQLTPIESVKRGISVIFQDFSLFQNLSVAENILFGDQILNNVKVLDYKKMRAKAKEVLDEMELDLDLNAVVGELPVAKHQMIAIARAIIQNSRLIIMDEPTSTLSGAEVEHLFRIIRRLTGKGISVLFVSHKLKELFTIAERFTIMRDGNYIGTFRKEELDEEKLISHMVGRKVVLVKHEEHEKGRAILQVKHLSRKGNYQDISFTLHEGEILGITGLVGSGRTEVLSTIFGLNPPEEGEIYFENKKVTIHSPYAAKKLGIAYVPEDRHELGFVGNKNMIQNISLPNLKEFSNSLGMINTSMEREVCENQMERLQVRPKLPEMLAGNLSGGNQQKIVIAKWLAANPKVLMIDEPTNGIDVGAKNEIHTIMQELARQGVAVLMVSSDLQEVLAISDRILVMRRGRLTGEFKANSDSEEIMSRAFLGNPEDYEDRHAVC
ncbi:MAG: sugar ABC transporter ATP-binding protein [Eubacteriales bacterium]|nr:sugar ABC transporter ATP-binding protein [Eubacteriales bacterium]